MTPEMAAWVAGIIEGEGSFAYHTNAPRIKVSMTDEDTIARLCEWTGAGNVYGPYVRPEGKPHWVWAVQSRAEFLHVADAIQPYLLSRRSAKLDSIRELMASWEAEVVARQPARARRYK